MRLALCLALLAAPASAESLCGVTDFARLEGLAGDWRASPRISLESLELSLMRAPGEETVTIGADLSLTTALLDSLGQAPLPLALEPLYDVDAVDDVLETTENEGLADILSDTPCGPEELPQLTGEIPETEGMGAAGTVTLIAYFDDRVLQIAELTLRSDEALFYTTITALLTPAD